jgi:hypothetical protein
VPRSVDTMHRSARWTSTRKTGSKRARVGSWRGLQQSTRQRFARVFSRTCMTRASGTRTTRPMDGRARTDSIPLRRTNVASLGGT